MLTASKRRTAPTAYCHSAERPFMRIAALLAFSLAAAGAYAQETSYLFDVLPKPAYHIAWDKLVKDVQPTPDWLMHFERNFDGVAGPMKPATIEGKPYELYFVCKPDDCAAKKFEVMFEAGGKRAYGALGGASDPPYFYGGPTPAMQEALTQALKG